MNEPEQETLQTKKQAVPYANVIAEANRRRQLRLLQMITGRVAIRTVRVIETRSGDDVFVTFYGKGREEKPDEKLIAWIWLVEQKRHTVKLEEVVHREGVYYLGDRDLTQLLMKGDYQY